MMLWRSKYFRKSKCNFYIIKLAKKKKKKSTVMQEPNKWFDNESILACTTQLLITIFFTA